MTIQHLTSCKEIKAILDSSNFDLSEAISQQIELLELKYKHIREIITFACEIKSINKFMTMLSELGKLKHLTPKADEVQNKIAALQRFITDNYYVCTNKILKGLGEMYVGDERFKNNIDKASYCDILQ